MPRRSSSSLGSFSSHQSASRCFFRRTSMTRLSVSWNPVRPMPILSMPPQMCARLRTSCFNLSREARFCSCSLFSRKQPTRSASGCGRHSLPPHQQEWQKAQQQPPPPPPWVRVCLHLLGLGRTRQRRWRSEFSRTASRAKSPSPFSASPCLLPAATRFAILCLSRGPSSLCPPTVQKQPRLRLRRPLRRRCLVRRRRRNPSAPFKVGAWTTISRPTSWASSTGSRL
mmetsp:Transcript_32943/g.67366  ORF Transcript_32943/g.67366 Transcript_32943/m.67366 type:complete len:227 (-) Transcript_32943:1314-1994(-)